MLWATARPSGGGTDSLTWVTRAERLGQGRQPEKNRRNERDGLAMSGPSALSAEEARGYPAVEMFEERAAFALGGYQISDTDAPYIAEICRRLDGIALAIELAAGRLPGLGVQGLANSLEDCFSILTHGRRTALPRHQTLRATLDWSYRLLSPEDQAALIRASSFERMTIRRLMPARAAASAAALMRRGGRLNSYRGYRNAASPTRARSLHGKPLSAQRLLVGRNRRGHSRHRPRAGQSEEPRPDAGGAFEDVIGFGQLRGAPGKQGALRQLVDRHARLVEHFLDADDAGFITGSTLSANGGQLTS